MPETNFLKLCELFESISTTKGKNEKLTILHNFTNKQKRGIHFFNTLRLLLPRWERERGPYRLGEHSFTKTLTNILCLPATGSDINLLKNYNQTSTGVNAKFKDYADAAYAVVRKKTHTNPSKQQKTLNTSIKDINDKLDAIAASNIRKQEEIIYDLFKNSSHLEIKWLIRIILREMKLGLGDADILQSYHKDGAKYFKTNNSLKQLCSDLEDRNKTASEIEVSLFNAFRPMLSLRCDVKEFNKSVIDDKEFYIEEKFDGERFQVHFARNSSQNEAKYKYFSRNGYDFTEEFSAHAQKVTKCLSAESAIFDGEMMIYNKVTKKFGSKGMAADIKKVKIDSNIQQCFCIFDIVYLNGENLCNTPLKNRKSLLKKVVTPMEGVIVISSWRIVTTRQEIVNALNISMDNKEEGIVFKCPAGSYLPNERVGWWKVKLEYFEGVMSDLDVLILGGYYGQGATKGEITGYLLGVKDTSNNQKPSKMSKFLSFAKISTGLTREETKTLNTHLNPFWQDFKGDKTLKNAQILEKFGILLGKEKPDKWIQPSNSKCLKVRGSELIKLYDNSSNSTMKDYATNYTLRFPRILGLRLDKPYEDVLTTEELRKLTEGSRVVEKLNKRHLELEDLIQPPTKRRKKNVLNFQRPDVEVVSDILEGYTFVVLSGLGNWEKPLVETAIRENGGTVAFDCTNDTLCRLVGDAHHPTEFYSGEFDIVRVEWLRNVLNEGEFVMYEPFDVVYMSEKSRRKFMQEFDEFGDSFTIPATRRSLEKVFRKYLKNGNVMHPTVDEINEFNAEIGLNAPKWKEWKVLRGYVAYFDRYKIINDVTSSELKWFQRGGYKERLEFKIAGGIVSEFLNVDCDCIIGAPERVEEIQVYLQSLRRDIPIYSSTENFKREILSKRGELL